MVPCVGRASARHGRLKSPLRHAILVGCGRCFTLTAIEASFSDFLNLGNISAVEPVWAQRVLDAYAHRLDFADALHAAQCLDGQRLMTLDKNFAKSARKAGLHGVSLLKS